MGVPGSLLCQLNARGRLGPELWTVAWPNRPEPEPAPGGEASGAGRRAFLAAPLPEQPFWPGIWASSASRRPRLPRAGRQHHGAPETPDPKSRSCADWQRGFARLEEALTKLLKQA